MKRIFAILVVALAIITLMTSVIVPHHHHGNVVCTVTSHCEHECGSGCRECDDEEDSSDCFRHCRNDGEDKSFHGDCVAKATYVISDQSEIKYKIRYYCGNSYNLHFVPVFLCLTNLYSPDVKFVYLTKHRYRKKDFFRESENGNCANGLRAPPYFIA
ncbi:MAG: hypothetical protein LBK97_07605 [Prevotellaceae bacterium]|jgi:hypothetical protein|nr:hypothetical protein [Prevotellaceae bacterium]